MNAPFSPLVDQIRRVTAAQSVVDGIDWADLSDPGNLLEASYFAAKDEVLELRRMLEREGIDPDVFGRALS